MGGAGVFAVVFKVLARSRHVFHFLLLLVLLTSLVSSILSTANLMAVQGSRLAERVKYSYFEARVLSSSDVAVEETCAVIGVSFVEACRGGRCLETRLLTPYAGSSGKVLGVKLKEDGVYVGYECASLLGAGKGDSLVIKGGGGDVEVRVAGVFRSRSGDDLALIGAGWGEPDFYELRCFSEDSNVLSLYVDRINGQVVWVARSWLYSAVLVFLVVSYVATLRLFMEVGGDLGVLLDVGAGYGLVMACSVVSVVLLSLLACLFGVAVGIVSSHAAVWSLRLFGILVFARPFLGAWDLAALFTVTCGTTLVASSLSFRSSMGGGRAGGAALHS